MARPLIWAGILIFAFYGCGDDSESVASSNDHPDAAGGGAHDATPDIREDRNQAGTSDAPDDASTDPIVTEDHAVADVAADVPVDGPGCPTYPLVFTPDAGAEARVR